MTRSSQTRAARDIFKCSDQDLTEFPAIPKPSAISTLIAANNLLTAVPDMRPFTILRSLDLSNNQFTDVSPVSAARNLRELDISGNEISDISFCAGLANLEVLRASGNAVATIDAPLPDSLSILILADNRLADLEFMESCLSPARLEVLDVSGNEVATLISLRYLPLFESLRDLKVGITETMPDVPVLQFVKFLCPTLESFDDESLGEIDAEFPDDELIDFLRSGDEAELRQFLIGALEPPIRWNPPEFVDFQGGAAVGELEERIRAVEARVPSSPERAGVDDAEIRAIKEDVRAIKEQVAQIARLLFVHDRALGQIWEGGVPTRDSF
jgi:hypothetical protein